MACLPTCTTVSHDPLCPHNGDVVFGDSTAVFAAIRTATAQERQKLRDRIRELEAEVEEWGTKETEQRVRATRAIADLAAAEETKERAMLAIEDEQRAAGNRAGRLAQALAFAASVIKGGEPWTPQCEELIAGALADEPLTVTPAQLASDHFYKTIPATYEPPPPKGPDFCPWCGAPTSSFTTRGRAGRERFEGVCSKCGGVWTVEGPNCGRPSAPDVHPFVYDPRPTLPSFCLCCGASGGYRSYATLAEPEKP